MTAAVLLGRGRGREQQEGEEVWPELEERGRGRPCRWWLRAPRRRRAFEGGHTEDAIGRLRVGRASGTSERQGESRYMPSEERVWPARGRTRVELGSRRIPRVACCRCSLVVVTVGSRIAYVDLRQPSQVAGLRRRGKGEGRERRRALPWEPGRQRQRSETGDGWALRMPGEERRQGCGSPAQERRRDGRDERRTRRRQGKIHPIVDWQWRRTTPSAGRDRRSVPLSR